MKRKQCFPLDMNLVPLVKHSHDVEPLPLARIMTVKLMLKLTKSAQILVLDNIKGDF